MKPEEIRTAGETVVALSPDPDLRDWRDALAQGLGVPRAEIESYASGERRLPPELGQRIGKLLQELGRRMSEPGRLAGRVRRRNENRNPASVDDGGPVPPVEAEGGVVPDGPPGPKRTK